MTAQVFAQFDLEGMEISGDAFDSVFADAPGTLWERVAEDPSGSLRRGLEESARGEAVDLGDFTQYVEGD